MTKKIAAAAVLLLAAALPSLAQTAKIELEVRYWSVATTGTAQISDRGFGTVVDLEEDLGLGDDQAWEGRFVWNTSRRSKLYFSYASLDLGGDATVSRTIYFAGREFTFNTRVVSDLRLEYARLGWAWQFLATKSNSVRFGPSLEAKGFRGTAGLSAPDLFLPVGVEESFEGGYPAAGLVFDAEPTPKWAIYAEGSMVLDNRYGNLVDYDAGVKFFPVPKFGIGIGYRHLDLDLEIDDDSLDMTMSGPYLGITGRF